MLERLEKLLLIRQGERSNVLYFLFFFLLVSAGMAIGRSTADALFLKRLGIEYLPLMYMLQGVMLAATSMLYAAFADRVPAEKFFTALFTTIIVLVFCSWMVMSSSTGTLVYPVYYIIYEVASELLLVHAALYMNQNMDTIQAKRLTPLVFAGAQAGTIIGGLFLVIAAPVFGTRNLLLFWCLLLVAGSVLMFTRHRRHGVSTHFRGPGKSCHLVKDCIEQINQGVKYTFSSDLLRASSFALFFMVIAFYILCYSVNRIYTQTFDSEESLTRFFGLLTATTSSVALFTQLFVTNRVIKRFGIRAINLLFPWTTLASLSVLTFSFTFPAALVGSLNKDAFMQAFRNPVRSMFFNILPDYIQGRARAMSVAIVLPLALLVCGLMLTLMQRLENPVYFLVPGITAAGLFLFFSTRMNHVYVSTLISTLKERLFLPDKQMYSQLTDCSDEAMNEIMRGISHPDIDVSAAFAKILVASFPEQAPEIIIRHALDRDNAARTRLLTLLEPVDITPCAGELHTIAHSGDAHLRVRIMRMLINNGDPLAGPESIKLLDSDNPRLRALAIHAGLQTPGSGTERGRIIDTWQALLASGREERLASLDIIADLASLSGHEKALLLEGYQQTFLELISQDSNEVKIRTMQAICLWQEETSHEVLESLFRYLSNEHPGLREAAANCLHLVDEGQRDELLLQAIGDSHIRVRNAGINALKAVSDVYDDLALEWISSNRGSLRAQQSLLRSLLESTLPTSVFEEIARTKASEARVAQQALCMLVKSPGSGASTAHTLLRHALKEHLDQTIELALMAMEPLYEPGIIGIIRAGFLSGDTRHVANACEALGNLDKKDIVSSLNEILQNSASNDFSKEKTAFQSIDDVLDWCAKNENDWLRSCGIKAMQPDNAHA
jgi:AAA family ATP:ADP antiporter